MGSLGSWLGSGAGLCVIGLAVLILRYKDDAHHKAEPWLVRTVVVLMFIGGTALATTVVGSWVVGLLLWLTGNTGGWGEAIAKLGGLTLFLTALLGGLWKARQGAAKAAAMLPLVLAMFSGGFLHNLEQATAPKARQASTVVSDWVGTVGKHGGK